MFGPSATGSTASSSSVLALLGLAAILLAAAAAVEGKPAGDLDLLSSPHGRVRRSVEFSHPLRRSSTGSYSYFRSPSTRSAPAFRGGHKLTARRTLPFQLVGESPMGYARSRSFVDDLGPSRVMPVHSLPAAPYVSASSEHGARVDTSREDSAAAAAAQAAAAAAEVPDNGEEEEVSPTELLDLLNKMAGNLENRHRVRFGFF